MDYVTEALPDELGTKIAEIMKLEEAPATLGQLVDLVSRASVTWSQADLCCASASPHVVEMDGATTFTYCALDALMLPILAGQAGVVRSACPHCDEEVSVVVGEGGLESSHPEAVLSFGVARTGDGPAQEVLCPYINLFPTASHYDRWVESTPGMISIPLRLDEAGDFFRNLAASGQRGPA